MEFNAPSAFVVVDFINGAKLSSAPKAFLVLF